MRRAIISDIHGNFRALQSVLEDISKQQVQEIITLGDNVGYGPEPEQVVNELQSRKIMSLMGNHELALISPSYFNRLNFIAQESLTITRSLLSSQSLDWLALLKPLALLNQTRLCHGCPPASMTKYLYAPSPVRLGRIFQSYHEQFCFSGHTHMLNCFTLRPDGSVDIKRLDCARFTLKQDHRYIILVGSVGQPRDTIDNKAKYVIWDDRKRTCEIRAVAYDVQQTIELLRFHNFPIHNAQRLQWSKEKP